MRKQLQVFFTFLIAITWLEPTVAQTTFGTVPPLTGGNGQFGITFEVEAAIPITVTGLGIVANTGTYTGIEIWYRPGGVQHIPNNAPVVTPANGWIMVGTTGFTSTSATAITQLPFLLNIPIAANQKMGFMINNPLSTPNTFVYSTGTGPLSYTNSQITLHVGTNAGYGGPAPNPANHPRNFNGSVTYTIGGGGGPVLPPIANFFPSQATTTTTPIDTVWLGSPATLVSTSQNASRVYWDLPNIPNLPAPLFRQPVPFTQEQYIDTNRFNRTLTYTFNQRGFQPVRLLAVNYMKIDSLRDSTVRFIYVDSPSRVPDADFITFKRKVGFGDYSNFLDLSNYGPNQWFWTFDPPCNKCNQAPFFNNFFAGPTDRNPLFFGGDPGKYTICLQAWNGRGWDSVCKPDYIEVLNSYSICSGTGATFTSDPEGYLFGPSGPGLSYTRSQLTGCTGIVIAPCADSITFFIERIKMLPTDSLVIRNGNSPSSPVVARVGGANVQSIPDRFRNGIRVGRIAHVSIVPGTGAIPNPYDSAGFNVRWSIDPPTYPKPIAIMDVPDTIYSNQPVTYRSRAIGTLFQNSWDSDGNGIFDSTAGQFTRSFFITTPQLRNICYVAYNCVGSDTVCKSVVFLPTNQRPVARITVDKTIGFNVDTFYFRDISLNGPSTWRWTFTPGSAQFLNGTSATSRNPEVRFTQRTKYTVKLVVTNAIGADSVTVLDYINIGAYDIPISITPIAQADGSIGISRVIVQNGIDTATNPFTPDYQFVQGNQTGFMYRGVKHAITVTRPGNTAAMDRKVWIDFNMNGNFENDELVMNDMNSTQMSRTDSVLVPVNQTLGTTRMRVGVTLANTTLNPAIAFLGVFRDYNINFPQDTVRPMIVLNGSSNLNTEINRPYVEPGVTAIDNIEGNISSRVEIFGTVNINQVGPNLLKYIVRDNYGNISDTVYRTVFVVLNQTGPSLTLNGPSIQYVEVYNKFNELGWVARDNNNNDISNQVVVAGNVDTAVLGSYTLTYRVTDAFGISASVTRLVNVGDTTRPVITPRFAAGKTVYEHQIGRVFDFEDAVVISDNYWKRSDLNVEFIGTVDANNPGTYFVIYRARDPRGNIANQVTVPIVVIDRIAPVVALNGLPEVQLEVFSTFNDPGVSVTENYWPVNTVLVQTRGAVNANVLGTYVRWYIATDPSGNSDSISRTIRVVDRTAPVIVLLGDNPFNLPRWREYVEPGISITDNYNSDAELRPGLITTNTLPLNNEGKPFGDAIGMYAVRYTVTDLSGNISETATRIVNVGEPITGVKNLNQVGVLASIYPNPSNGMVKLMLVQPAKTNVNVQVFDALGKVVFTKQIADGALQTDLNLTHLSKGIYFISLQIDGQTAVQKLQIQ